MRLPQRRSGAGRTWALGGVGLSLAILAGALQPLQVADAAPVATRAGSSPDTSTTVAADMFAARINAVRLHHPVEALSERSDQTRVFANPDGTTSREVAAAPVRVRDASATDGWRDVDLDLAARPDGSLAPKVPLREVTLSAGGSDNAPLVTLEPSKSKSLALDWDKPLPKPHLDGSTATYEDVAPDTDLVVTATRFGFEQSFVIKEKPADPASIELPLSVKADGLVVADPVSSDQSGMQLKDDTGKVIGEVSSAVTWDASVDRSGQPDNTTVSDLTLEKVDGAPTLTLKPDADFLSDPDTEYPVTVDPSFTVNTEADISDTFVRSDYPTTNYVSSTELQVGTYNSGTSVARSYLKFAGTNINGKVVSSASLKVYEFHSYSCTAANLDVYASSSKDFSVSTWNSNQPGLNTSTKSTVSTAKGYSSSCAAGWVTLNVTDATQYWADQNVDHYNYGLRASETSNSGWKRFDSSDGTHVPVLTVSYNVAPSTPKSLDAAGQVNGSAKYVSTPKPTLSGTFTDTDSDNARLAFEVYDGSSASSANKVATCTTAYVSPSSTASCAVTSALSDNRTYWYRAQAQSSYQGMTSGWSGMSSLKTAIGAPSIPPSISCGSYSNGSWASARPSNAVSCTITTPTSGDNTAATWINAAVDGGQSQGQGVSLGSAGTLTVSVPNTSGMHTVTALSYSLFGTTQAAAMTYTFGYGSAGMTTPKPGTTTTNAVNVAANAPPRGNSSVAALFSWRVAGQSWSNDIAIPGALVAGGTGSGPVTVSNFRWSARDALKAAGANMRRSALLELRVCFTYSGVSGARCTTDSAAPTTVVFQPHAFGNGYPTSSAGEGTVALWSGELALDANDVNIPTNLGNLNVTRSHSTFLDPADSVSGVFGPGWAASFGDESDASSYQIVDSTGADGTISLTTSDDSPLVFREPNGGQESQKVGTYTPVNDAAITSGYQLTLSGIGADARLTLVGIDGAKTIWALVDGPAWILLSSTQAESHSTVTYSADANRRVRRILAPVPAGVGCGTTEDDMVAGCSALLLSYSGLDASSRVTSIEYKSWDPSAHAMVKTVVASYTYDGSGRLATATDPRLGLTTTYEYAPQGAYGDNTVVTKISHTGFAPYVYNYAGTASSPRLQNVQRGPADGGQAAPTSIASFVYDIPAGTAGLPVLGQAEVSKWGQTDVPTKAYAVFDADHPVTSSDPSSGAISETDYSYATLHFTNDDGYETNLDEYGSGRWLTTAAFYDYAGRLRYTLDPVNTAGLSDGSITSATAGAALTRWNADEGSGTSFVPAHTYVTDSWTPAYTASVNGMSRPVRVHTHYTYDEGAPSAVNPATGLPYKLVTTTQIGISDSNELHDDPAVSIGPDLKSIQTITTGYDPIDGKPATDPTSGWTLGMPTSTTTAMANSSDNIVRKTRYDADGNVIESREPGSSGTDAGSTLSLFYSASSSTDTACGYKAEWAGLPCWSGPAAPPSTGQDIPDRRVESYNRYLNPMSIHEESGSGSAVVSRTTAMTYATNDLLLDTTSVSTSGLTGSVPVARSRALYEPTTKVRVGTAALNTSGQVASQITSAFDAWGRTTRYTDAAGNVTTTTYVGPGTPGAGQVSTVSDAQDTASYTYDGNDAAGNAERRGLATRVDGYRSGPWLAAYDLDGNLVRQTMPGSALTQERSYDVVNRITTIKYSDLAGRIVTFNRTYNGAGQVDTDSDSTGASTTYTYDGASRLASASATTPALDATPASCTTRSYTFDVRGNRTNLATASGSSCTTASSAVGTFAYDDFSRQQSGVNGAGAYVYDAFGRQTAIPASDAANSTSETTSIAYYDTDAVRSLTQSGTTTTFALDPAGRRLSETTGTATTANAYGDDDDSPAWATRTLGSTVTTTRYVSDLTGAFGAQIDTTGGARSVYVPLVRPSGSIAASISIPSSGSAVVAGPYASYDEYGRGAGSAAPTGVVSYGWHGRDQRERSDSGLSLMGARLYNPSTGRFTSEDPVPGGNENAYAYPNDPVNSQDLNGQSRVPDGGGRIEPPSPRGGGWGGRGFTGLVKRIVQVVTKGWRPPKVGRASGGAASVSKITRRAASGSGNFGVGSGSAKTSAAAGRAWVGKGSRVASDGKTVISSDGLRQYRPPTYKPRLGKTQSNFESRPAPRGPWRNNGHMDITDR